jgi:hypothetical protein
MGLGLAGSRDSFDSGDKEVKYAKRLQLDIDVHDILSAERQLIQTTDRAVMHKYPHSTWLTLEHEGTPLRMYSLPKEVTDRVVSQLPKEILDREVPGVYLMMAEKPEPTPSILPPHIDRARRTAINIYLETDGEETQFFDAHEEDKSFTLLESFIAKTGEAWALDVSKVHGVIMGNAMRRSGLSLSFRKVKYEELVNLL